MKYTFYTRNAHWLRKGRFKQIGAPDKKWEWVMGWGGWHVNKLVDPDINPLFRTMPQRFKPEGRLR